MDFYIKNRIIQLDEDSLLKDNKLVTYNKGYVANFFFDEEWEGKEKTARFIRGKYYKDVILDDDKCEIPLEIMGHIVEVGVFAGDLKSTTATYIKFLPSILHKMGLPVDPTPDVYNQLMTAIENIREEAVTDEEIQIAVDNYLNENPIGTTYKIWSAEDFEV